MKKRQRRCLIVERHDWETGGAQQQVQLPLRIANEFFGPGGSALPISVRVFMPATANTPAFERRASISKEYNNGTRRINRFPELGAIQESCFIFFEETDTDNTYDVWWQSRDMQVIAAKYNDWSQGQNSQYGRGRLIIIVPAPVPRFIVHI